MVREAVRGYLALATGMTEVTAGRARAAAKALVEQGEATAAQVSSLAEDLLSTSRRNRESLALLVRHEVEQAVKRLGLAPAAQTDDLTRRVRDLERAVRELKASASAPSNKAPAKKPPAKKAPAKASGQRKAAGS